MCDRYEIMIFPLLSHLMVPLPFRVPACQRSHIWGKGRFVPSPAKLLGVELRKGAGGAWLYGHGKVLGGSFRVSTCSWYLTAGTAAPKLFLTRS